LGLLPVHQLAHPATKQRFPALTQEKLRPPGLPIAARDLPRPRFAIPAGYRHGLAPTPAEGEANPRSRSSRLRVVERTLP